MARSNVESETLQLVKQPHLYQVTMLNDDFTPMVFVVEVLKKYFDKSHAEATEIMLAIHHTGQGICGVYPFDIAETKATLVHRDAERQQYPLRCVLHKI